MVAFILSFSLPAILIMTASLLVFCWKDSAKKKEKQTRTAHGHMPKEPSPGSKSIGSQENAPKSKESGTAVDEKKRKDPPENKNNGLVFKFDFAPSVDEDNDKNKTVLDSVDQDENPLLDKRVQAKLQKAKENKAKMKTEAEIHTDTTQKSENEMVPWGVEAGQLTLGRGVYSTKTQTKTKATTMTQMNTLLPMSAKTQMKTMTMKTSMIRKSEEADVTLEGLMPVASLNKIQNPRKIESKIMKKPEGKQMKYNSPKKKSSACPTQQPKKAPPNRSQSLQVQNTVSSVSNGHSLKNGGTPPPLPKTSSAPEAEQKKVK